MLVCRRFFASKNSKRQNVIDYVKRQSTDYYSRLAKEHSYRARSAFKLAAINHKYKIIRPDSVVVDIGAAPGSWCQVASEIVSPTASGSKGFVLGVDLLPIDALPGVHLIAPAGDITRRSVHAKMRELLGGRRVNALLSDMAPNPTGDSYTDHLRILELVRVVVRLAFESSGEENTPVLSLAPRASFLCKIFDGPYSKDFQKELEGRFETVRVVKPDASRETSSEKYFLARNPLPQK